MSTECDDDQGRPIRNPEKDTTIPGSIVSSEVTNYPPPTYSIDTGLFYFAVKKSIAAISS
jgi:hypothetical protein